MSDIESLDIETLQFLVDKSEDVIAAQLESQRAKEANSGVLIGVISLFIPFFFNGLTEAPVWLKVFSVLPSGTFLVALILFVRILQGRPMMRSISPEKYKDLVSLKYREVLLKDLGANYTAYVENMKLYNVSLNYYNLAVSVTAVAVVISAIILSASRFL